MKRSAESSPQVRLEQTIRVAMLANVIRYFLSILPLGCLLPAHAAVTLNQIEDFSSATQWDGGSPNPNPPGILADSGPLGAGDSSLRVVSNGGSGPGGRLIVFNQSTWSGDYLAAGIISIAADMRNNGTTMLSMRLAFNGPGGWFVTASSPVAAFSGWTSHVFDIRPADLIPAGGSNAAATLSSVSEMRILHSSAAEFRGTRLSSSFLVDNIQAVPEPSAAALSLLLASVGLLYRRRRIGGIDE
jgi:hypothetical protein